MREAFQSMWGIGKKSADLMTNRPLFDYSYLMLAFLELNFQSCFLKQDFQMEYLMWLMVIKKL